jgi:hypothetical protein
MPVFHISAVLLLFNQRKAVLPQSYQDLLHRVVPIPLRNATKSRQLDLDLWYIRHRQTWGLMVVVSGQTDLSILLVDAGEINLRDEFNGGRLVRITTAAIDLKIVDAVLVCALCQTSVQSLLVIMLQYGGNSDAHEEGRGWSRSSWTSSHRRHQ